MLVGLVVVLFSHPPNSTHRKVVRFYRFYIFIFLARLQELEQCVCVCLLSSRVFLSMNRRDSEFLCEHRRQTINIAVSNHSTLIFEKGICLSLIGNATNYFIDCFGINEIPKPMSGISCLFQKLHIAIYHSNIHFPFHETYSISELDCCFYIILFFTILPSVKFICWNSE